MQIYSSSGGRGDFKWTDVKDSSHRENYLGHSLMAPVGRWQKGRDLGWYAKSGEDDSEEAADRAKRELEDERRRVKEAEQEAMARALGLPVAPKTSDANLTPLGGGDVRKAVQGAAETDDRDDEGGRGIGFGSYGGHVMDAPEGEILAPVGLDSNTGHRASRRDGSPRDSRPRRDRSRDRDDRDRRRHEHRDRHHRRAHGRVDREGRHESGRDKNRERSHRDDDHDRSERRKHQRRDRRRPSRSRSRSPRREEHRHDRESARVYGSRTDSRREADRHDHRRERRHSDRERRT
jgi:hypothetical protein